MNALKFKCCVVFVFGVIISGAFSLLWIRQGIFLQTSQMQILEKKLASLQALDQRADICIQHLQKSNTTHLQSRQILWITPKENLNYTPVAYNY